MLVATVLALAAAVLHAGWNLAVKQSGDRFLALWGQFAVAAMIGLAVLVVAGVVASTTDLVEPFPASGWAWALLSGVVHVPYCWFLARAYDRGDFSLVYPMARGGGALLAAIGGIVLLGDHLSALGSVAIAIVGGGLVMLSGRGRGADVRAALAVAVTIGAYSLADARGIRSTGTALYPMASFVAIGVALTVFGIGSRRGTTMRAAMRASWRRFSVLGAASMVTYAMVQLAFQRAPVGYVTALRESSVVLAAFVGSRMLGEPAGPRRIIASAVVLGGLVLLVLTA